MHSKTSEVKEAPRPISRLTRPFKEFARLQASSGILLLGCTMLALLWANSPWATSYFGILETKVSVLIGDAGIRKTVLHWINDFLMAIFFFVVGLEIKREALTGELSSLRQAALPVAAAVGGMAVPAALYFALNGTGAGASGWGIPMATDIAFALGVLALLGNRVPLSLRVFLTAFAIVDDIGAVMIIAVFYTSEIAFGALLVGFVFLALAALANWSGIRNPLIYSLIGLVMWVAFLQSGIHATVAGVLLATTIPVRSHLDPRTFSRRIRELVSRFDAADDRSKDAVTTNQERQEAVYAIEDASERVQTPLDRLEHALQPWVTFFIMPLFALANAGVSLRGILSSEGAGILGPIPLGIILGLAIGKPIGVTLLSWLAVRTGLAVMPSGVTWRHLLGAGWLGGIGFTMALFIGSLAFPEGINLDRAKLGILGGSLVAGVIGYVLLRGTGEQDPAPSR